MSKFIFISIFGLIIILHSCTSNRYIYTASPANNPYFTEKGQSKLTAYYSSNGAEGDVAGSGKTNPQSRDNGADIQGAYAFGTNWALTAGYYHRNETDFDLISSKDFIVKYKRDLFDVGGGFFIPLNKRKSFTFNFYTGAAVGKFSLTDQNKIADYTRFHSAAITKWYIQPSFNYIWSEYVRIGLILKNSFVHYGNIQTNYTNVEKESFGLNLIENRTLSFFEPEWNIQLGMPQLPWVKLDLVSSY
ncbi:MAG: hypothetical protein ABI123_06780, partial [Ginsengibacter sp.]